MPMSIRRLAVLCTAMLCAGMLVLCRVFWIAADQSYAASAAAQTVSETVLPIRRGNFYDRIGRPLTGVTPRWYALCIPGDSSYATLFPFVPFAQQAQLYARRNSITPFLIEVEDDLSANGVFMVADARRYLPTPIARHLIGYLDGDGHGMTGLEKAYDDLLAAAGDAQAVLCTTTARGDLLAGTTPQVQTTARGTNTAITLTLDANIQRACEAIAAKNISKGCIIVMQVGSGQILASSSMPEFDPDDIAASIRADDTSLINRSLSAFSAGSVFKVVLAAAAYAQGLDWFTYDCTGSIQTAGETFRCALGRAHGTVNLRGALEQSCNCYFIALGQLLGGQAILNAAQSFGLGTPALLAPGLKSAAGELPSAADLQNAGSLASLSFGQGGLTVTPLQVTAMFNAIASGGVYHSPCIVSSITGGTQVPQQPQPAAACSPAVARVLQSMLATVVRSGIGGDAQPHTGTAAGKTGTAQTGQFDADGRELLHYWFAGFYPADAPRYTITVLQDSQQKPQTSSAALFAQVADALAVLDAAITEKPAENS